MKRITKPAIVMALGIFAASCIPQDTDRPEPATLELSATEIEFSGSKGTESVTVKTNATSWSVTDTGEWLSTVKQGESFDVVAEANPGISKRSCDILVIADGVSRTIRVTQSESAPTLTIRDIEDESEVIALNSGMEAFYSVESNTAWNILSDEDTTWLTVKKLGSEIFQLKVNPSDSETERTAEVTIEAGAARKVLTVVQKGVTKKASGKFFLPLLTKKLLWDEVFAYEKAQGHTPFKSSVINQYYEAVYFATPSPVFQDFSYKFDLGTKRISDVITLYARILERFDEKQEQDEFLSYLESQGYKRQSYDQTDKDGVRTVFFIKEDAVTVDYVNGEKKETVTTWYYRVKMGQASEPSARDKYAYAKISPSPQKPTELK